MVNFPPPSPETVILDSDEEEDGLADQTPLDLKWVSVSEYEIAVCPLPGTRLGGARRSLAADLATLKEEKITEVYVICTKAELRRAKVHNLMEEYHMRGFSAHHYPLDDEQPPEMQHCLLLLESLYTCLQEGRRVAVHCTDGLGRSCSVLALFAMMLDPDLPGLLAIEHVRHFKGPRAIQTIKQYNFIVDFHKNLAEFKRSHRHSYPLAVPLATPLAISTAH